MQPRSFDDEPFPTYPLIAIGSLERACAWASVHPQTIEYMPSGLALIVSTSTEPVMSWNCRQ